MARKPAATEAAPDDPSAPRYTTDLLGQEAAEAELLAAWTGGRMHHAWLITGRRGIGKATLAYRTARFILSGGEGEGGGLFGGPPTSLVTPLSHPACRLIAQGAHPDLRVIERQWDDKKKKRRSEIVVEDVRDLGGFLSMTASDGGWRVVIIDAADEMNRNAANALLKNLEEPPKRVVMLLLAHAPARLLPTIRSRCRVLTLKPLATETVASLLRQRDPTLDDDDARALARLGEGSIGRASELADAGGLQFYQQMTAVLRTLPRLDGPALYDFIDNATKSDESFEIAVEVLSWWLARTITAGGRQDAPAEIIPGENGLMRVLLAGAPLARWVEVWEKINRLVERTAAVNLDKKQVLLTAFLSVERMVRSS